MKKIFFKKRKAIASITIVMLLGFISLLTMTSVFSYNSWRWEALNNSIKKDNYANAVDSLTLMQYVLLVRNRALTPTELTVYDTYENESLDVKTTVNIGSITTMSNCNTVELPTGYSDMSVKRITAYNQYMNFYNNKTCCTAGVFEGTDENELLIEEILNTYSKENCKNMNWPNIKENSESIITPNIIQ